MQFLLQVSRKGKLDAVSYIPSICNVNNNNSNYFFFLLLSLIIIIINNRQPTYEIPAVGPHKPYLFIYLCT